MTGSTKPSKPFLLGIAGGSGSGKTHLAKAICSALGPSRAQIIYQDNFYIDQSSRFDHDGGAVNFDHPDSLDFKRMAECLNELKSGRAVNVPIYDFASHKRKAETLLVQPTPLVIVDGILIFHSSEVRDLLHERIFCHTTESVRFARRLKRDIHERGRTEEGVRNQFNKQVKPMHDQFVEPSKVHAHTVIHEDSGFEEILKRLTKRFA